MLLLSYSVYLYVSLWVIYCMYCGQNWTCPISTCFVMFVAQGNHLTYKIFLFLKRCPSYFAFFNLLSLVWPVATVVTVSIWSMEAVPGKQLNQNPNLSGTQMKCDFVLTWYNCLQMMSLNSLWPRSAGSTLLYSGFLPDSTKPLPKPILICHQ